MKVLVIEDEPSIREIYADFLELLGHEADLVADGHEALARFDPLVHHVVVTDFLMPGLTGSETAQAIRARSATTPIVMISGSARTPEENGAQQAGVHFLRKPVEFATFKAALEAIAASSEAR